MEAKGFGFASYCFRLVTLLLSIVRVTATCLHTALTSRGSIGIARQRLSRKSARQQAASCGPESVIGFHSLASALPRYSMLRLLNLDKTAVEVSIRQGVGFPSLGPAY